MLALVKIVLWVIILLIGDRLFIRYHYATLPGLEGVATTPTAFYLYIQKLSEQFLPEVVFPLFIVSMVVLLAYGLVCALVTGSSYSSFWKIVTSYSLIQGIYQSSFYWIGGKPTVSSFFEYLILPFVIAALVMLIGFWLFRMVRFKVPVLRLKKRVIK